MARITVEDCLAHVDNRFDLVLKASKRARKLAISGVDPMLDWQNDKPTVMALREIAAGHKFSDSDLNLNHRGYAAAVGNAAEIAADVFVDQLRDRNKDGIGQSIQDASSSMARTIESSDLGDETHDLDTPGFDAPAATQKPESDEL